MSLEKDLESIIMNEVEQLAKEEVLDMEYDVECPHCHAEVSILPGKHACPLCGEMIDLTLDADF